MDAAYAPMPLVVIPSPSLLDNFIYSLAYLIFEVVGVSALRNVHSKPEHNRYDNIWEIRSEGYPTKSQLADAVGYRPRPDDVRPYAGGRILCYRSEEAFCSTLIRKRFKLPIWKVILPEPGASMGAIYYAAEDAEGRLHLFRGTYGYWGTGPHQSAFIEAFVEEVLGLRLELREGDLLVDLILGRVIGGA